MEFNISNVNVYGMDESIIASGYPKSVNVNEVASDMKRANILGSAKSGSGHDCFLKGVIVQCDITAPQYFWMQWERYHFADIVSSQSKMHKILEMDIVEQCNEYVDEVIIHRLKTLIECHKNTVDKEDKEFFFRKIISNCPMGLMLTAKITTNYLQIKSMVLQRENHKTEEWKHFCRWAKELPNFKELTNK